MISVCFMMIKVCLPNWSFVWMKALTSSCEYISMLCYLSSPFILGGYEVGTGGLSETQASCVAFSWTCVIYGFFCSDMSFKKNSILCLAETQHISSLICSHSHFCYNFFSYPIWKKNFAYHICHFSSMLEKMWSYELAQSPQNSSKRSYEITCVLFNGI